MASITLDRAERDELRTYIASRLDGLGGIETEEEVRAATD